MTKQQHDDKKAKVGRPLLYNKRMVRKSLCVPEDWVERLQADFGNFSTGARAVIENYLKTAAGIQSVTGLNQGEGTMLSPNKKERP